MIQKGNATLLQHSPKDYLVVVIDRSKCLHPISSNTLFCMYFFGNMIYHKVSHGDVSYRFNGENVNIVSKFNVQSMIRLLI